MALNYTSYQTQIQDLIPSLSSAQFSIMSPGMIDYAEQRLYRDLDLLATRVVDASGSFTPGNRTFTFPSTFVVTDEINVLLNGTRVAALVPVARDVLNNLWPTPTGSGIPQQFAMLTDQTILVGPWPDAAYTVEVVGTQRPAPLSASNPTTWLTLYIPDLFIAASMVYASGWMRNFGSQADDPQMAGSWETQYTKLLASAEVEELRKRFAGPGWTSREPTPLATQGQ